jgi:hypothetical protein
MDGHAQILDDLVAISIQSASESVPLLTAGDKRDVPALFQRVMLSNIDNDCSSAISIRGHFLLPQVFRADAYLMQGERESDSSLNESEITMRGCGLEVALRHLLQAADPLPVFDTMPTLTLREFFNQYLVRRGPQETFDMRSELLDMLDSNCQWDSTRDIITAMNSTSLHRTKEIQALSTITSIIKKCQRLDDLTSEIAADAEKVFLLHLMEPAFQLTCPNPTVDYSIDFGRIPRDLMTLTKSNQQSHTRYFQTVAYGYLTAGLEFHRFRESRRNLPPLDERMMKTIASQRNELINETFEDMDHSTCEKAELIGALKAHVLGLRKMPHLLEAMHRSAVESNPLPKIDGFCRIMNEVCTMVMEAFVHKEIGEDHLMPVRMAFVYLANPSFIVSNAVFLTLTALQAPFHNVFQGKDIHPKVVLVHAVERLLGVSILDLLGP